MSTPTIRAALERLIELEDAASTNGADPDTTVWDEAVAAGRDALNAEPEPGAKPSLDDVYGLCEEFGFYLEGDTDESAGVLRDMITAAITRWAASATPPVPEPEEAQP